MAVPGQSAAFGARCGGGGFGGIDNASLALVVVGLALWAGRHWLFKREGAGDLQERVLRTVTEQLALDDYAWVPEYFAVTQDLVKPTVKGWVPNAKDFNRTRWLRLVEKPPLP